VRGDINLDALAHGSFHATRTTDGACAWLGTKRQPFIWPVGYSVRFDPVVLVDSNGRVVAHEGDNLAVGGGFGTVTVPSPCARVGQSAWFSNYAEPVERASLEPSP
jgi:hypothetical protein